MRCSARCFLRPAACVTFARLDACGTGRRSRGAARSSPSLYRQRRQLHARDQGHRPLDRKQRVSFDGNLRSSVFSYAYPRPLHMYAPSQLCAHTQALAAVKDADLVALHRQMEAERRRFVAAARPDPAPPSPRWSSGSLVESPGGGGRRSGSAAPSEVEVESLRCALGQVQRENETLTEELDKVRGLPLPSEFAAHCSRRHTTTLPRPFKQL